MSEFESVFESDAETGPQSGRRSDGKLKWAVYRLNEETYSRLLAKRQRGEKINFKERGGDHQLTSANRKPTPERLSDECGSGYFIIEHLFGGVADDWSFVRIDPSVAQVGSEQVAASPNVVGPQSRDRAMELVLERLDELSARGRYSDSPRRVNRERHRVIRRSSSESGSDSASHQQIQLVLELQRESREQERAMWQQLLESARSATARSTSDGPQQSVDNPYALFAPLAASNPSLAEKLLDRAFPEEEKTSWMGDILKHPQEAMQLVQAGVSLIASRAGTTPPAGGSGPAGAASPSQPVVATEQEAMTLIVFTLIDDVAKNRRVGRAADLIEEQCRKFPTLAPHVVQILQASNAGIFQQIQSSTGVDLTTYAHAGDFFDELREELENSFSADDADGSGDLGAPPSEVSRNGHDSTAAKAAVAQAS